MSNLKNRIKQKARQLGFVLAGVTSCESPSNYDMFDAWLNLGMHGTMEYLAEERNRNRRADPKQILPECTSILVLGIPYHPATTGQIASYAIGMDYHDTLPGKMQEIVDFIAEQLGHSIPHRCYTDTGPILERELASRAGLGWIGKNSCLIHPGAGSTFFLAEILLGVELDPDPPYPADHCGTCTRCLEACPTNCILPNRTLDARRCISYLTIELKENIPEDLRPLMQDWVFGCDICQQVCPWNRFSLPADAAFAPFMPLPVRISDLTMTAAEFNRRFKGSPIRRAKRRGYLRNLSVAAGNRGRHQDLPILKEALQHEEPMVQEHAKWAIQRITREEA